MRTSPGRHEKLFLEQLHLVERVTESVCRRHACYGAEAEDFAANVKLKLIDNGYAVLRKFQGKSLFATYLTTVVVNLFRDYRIQKWGKWRPSATAQRLGPLAVKLESLLYRDGYRLEEAIEILRVNFQVETSARELRELAARLPAKSPRRIVGEDQLPELTAPEAAEDRVATRERAAARGRAEAALAKALAELPPTERLILKLRFQNGHTVARIAGLLQLEQRPLYSRIEKLLKSLRAALEREGVDAELVGSLLDGG